VSLARVLGLARREILSAFMVAYPQAQIPVHLPPQ